MCSWKRGPPKLQIIPGTPEYSTRQEADFEDAGLIGIGVATFDGGTGLHPDRSGRKFRLLAVQPVQPLTLVGVQKSLMATTGQVHQ